MTAKQLIAEGRAIQRKCNLLMPSGDGEPVAIWFELDSDDENITEWRRWMTVRADALPDAKAPATVFFSLYTSGLEKGLLDFVDGWPPWNGTPLYAHPTSVLPPLDAVFALGSEEVGKWLAAHHWPRTQRYDRNFGDPQVVGPYQEIWFVEHPILKNDADVYAFTGGWHLPGQDDDWHDLISAKLLLTTVRDSEPWVEVFQMPDKEYKVLQRIT
jgi:hypothetical protein